MGVIIRKRCHLEFRSLAVINARFIRTETFFKTRRFLLHRECNIFIKSEMCRDKKNEWKEETTSEELYLFIYNYNNYGCFCKMNLLDCGEFLPSARWRFSLDLQYSSIHLRARKNSTMSYRYGNENVFYFFIFSQYFANSLRNFFFWVRKLFHWNLRRSPSFQTAQIFLPFYGIKWIDYAISIIVTFAFHYLFVEKKTRKNVIIRVTNCWCCW